MKTTDKQKILQKHREEIFELAARWGARNVRVFGSVDRGTADEASDIDFLIDLDDGRNLLDMGGLLMDLQKLLGCNVDVATPDLLRKRIRQRVLDEAVPL